MVPSVSGEKGPSRVLRFDLHVSPLALHSLLLVVSVTGRVGLLPTYPRGHRRTPSSRWYSGSTVTGRETRTLPPGTYGVTRRPTWCTRCLGVSCLVSFRSTKKFLCKGRCLNFHGLSVILFVLFRTYLDTKFEISCVLAVVSRTVSIGVQERPID